MKTIIYTSFPCIIKLNNEQESLSQNENLVIEQDFDKILVYPAQKGKISFEVSLNEHETSFYRIIERDNKRLIFLLDGLYAENAEICEFEYKGIKSRIEVYPHKTIFSGRDSKKIIHLNQQYRSFKYGNIKFIDFCLLTNFNDEKTLIVYNAKKNTAKVFNGSDIKEEENGFSISTSAFGYSSITQELYVDEDGLKVRKKNFIQSATNLAPEETLAYQFLNSIKYGDYEKCLTMLDSELFDRLNCESLKAYFGNISYFYMISPYSAYAISDNKNIIFEFQIKNNKINEISSE